MRIWVSAELRIIAMLIALLGMFVLWIVAGPNFCANTGKTGISKQECEALLALSPQVQSWLEPTGVDKQFTRITWFNTALNYVIQACKGPRPINETPCKWPGVTCVEGQVTAIYITTARIETLPAEIGQLTHLRSLHLPRNHLTTLPAEIGDLTNLEVLRLEYNDLTHLPPEFGTLIRLQEVWLNHNRLIGLPVNFGNLENLRELHLTDNHLTALPSETGHLTDLQELWLGDNRLDSLPDGMLQLGNLGMISLCGNPLIVDAPEVKSFVLERDREWAAGCPDDD